MHILPRSDPVHPVSRLLLRCQQTYPVYLVYANLLRAKMKIKHSFLSFIFYAIPVVVVLSWWAFAFNPKNSDPIPSYIPYANKQKDVPPIIKYLSLIQRETLHTALSGDYHMMIKLITDWDHDAQIMEQFGMQDVKRLSKKDFLRSQLLARQINSSSPEELDILHDYFRVSHVVDDNGNLFDLSKTYRRFLPQSYVAASFLLALSEPESLVALPRGMREQKNIFPQKITQLIALDADRYNAEKLYEARPEIAFVADYSHPSTVQALQNQGIPLFTLKHVNSPEEIKNALIRIGNLVNRPLEAELLNFFVEAAMQAIDNRFKILNASFNSPETSPKVLFLKHHLTFSTPTGNTLTGKLLKRMGVKNLFGDESISNKSAWTIPIHQEQILEISPDYIIICTNCINSSKSNILKQPVFHMLANKQIAFIDDALQDSPSQYMVLAYYDIFKALTYANMP